MLLLTASVMAASSWAHEYKQGDISVLHPYSSPTPPGVKVSAGYFEVINNGETDDRLVGAQTTIADTVSMHRSQMDGDVAQMREMKDGVQIAAGDTFTLTPGSHHLMFEGLTIQLVPEYRFTVTLEFEDAGSIDVEFVVEQPAEPEIVDHSKMH